MSDTRFTGGPFPASDAVVTVDGTTITGNGADVPLSATGGALPDPAVFTGDVEIDGLLTGANGGSGLTIADNVQIAQTKVLSVDSIASFPNAELLLSTGGAPDTVRTDAKLIVGGLLGVPKTLEVTGVATFDNDVNVSGAITASGGQVAGANGAFGSLDVGGDCVIGGDIGFYGTAQQPKPTITGSRGGNAALASLLTALAGLGLITDNSS